MVLLRNHLESQAGSGTFEKADPASGLDGFATITAILFNCITISLLISWQLKVICITIVSGNLMARRPWERRKPPEGRFPWSGPTSDPPFWRIGRQQGVGPSGGSGTVGEMNTPLVYQPHGFSRGAFLVLQISCPGFPAEDLRVIQQAAQQGRPRRQGFSRGGVPLLRLPFSSLHPLFTGSHFRFLRSEK